jgi:hypothetical protein
MKTAAQDSMQLRSFTSIQSNALIAAPAFPSARYQAIFALDDLPENGSTMRN